MNKKFAVKVHNEYLSEAVQKMAFKYGYKKDGIEYPVDKSVLYFEGRLFTWYYFETLNRYPEIPTFDAKTDWDKIEQAMKPVEPREIWVNEYKDTMGLIYKSSADAEKHISDGYIRTIKFREVIE